MHSNNPLLSTLVYDVEFPDGDMKKYAANLITENLLSQFNPDGFHTNILKAILDHKQDGTAVPMSEKCFKTKQVRQSIFKIPWDRNYKSSGRMASSHGLNLRT